MPAAYYDFFRKIVLQPDGVTLEADSVTDTLTITGGGGVALNPNASTDSFEIDVDYQLYVPIGTTELRLQDVNSNYTSVSITAGSNISVQRNSNNELVITGTVGGTSKAISNASQTNPVVITTSNNHQFTESIAVTITDVAGMIELNGNEYYMDILTSTTFALYDDPELTSPVDGTSFTPYSTGGVATAEYGAPQSLTQLNDVDFVSNPPVNGSYLQYNGSYWGIGTTLSGDFIGSVFADDSTVLVDGVNGIIPKANIEDSTNWDTAYSWGDHTLGGYALQTATYTKAEVDAAIAAPGDIKGSVFADDSTLLIDAVNGIIPKANIEDSASWDIAYNWGNHALEGYLTSAPNLNSVLVAGNQSSGGIDVGASTISGITITGTILDTVDSSPVIFTPGVTFDTEITVSDVLPSLNTAIDLGSTTSRYREVHSQTLNALDPTQSGFSGDGRVRTNRVYFGDESYNAYLYANSTNFWSWQGAMDPGNIFHNRTSTYARWKSTSQLVFSDHSGVSGIEDVDFFESDTHYFYQPTGALTLNFTNIPNASNRMINMRIYIYQGTTAYIPSNFQVNGVTVTTIDWQNGIIPAGTPNNVDFVQYLIWSFGSGVYTILAQANSYS